jgi:hypothetical protein
VNLGYKPSSTFGNIFYRLPFTPPLWSPHRSFTRGRRSSRRWQLAILLALTLVAEAAARHPPYPNPYRSPTLPRSSSAAFRSGIHQGGDGDRRPTARRSRACHHPWEPLVGLLKERRRVPMEKATSTGTLEL